MGGGASQIAATLDESLVSVLALNPTVIFEDCAVCSGFEYCICLVPDFLNHSVPTLIFAGENEVDELPDYDGLLGQDCYVNTPETTQKFYLKAPLQVMVLHLIPINKLQVMLLIGLNFKR